jgi:hypothetical protein
MNATLRLSNGAVRSDRAWNRVCANAK